MRFDAIIFDFDGVLIESEVVGNRELAALLTSLGYPHSAEETLRHYVGLAGRDFITAIENRIGAPLTQEFHDHIKQMSAKALRDGIDAVAGAVDFVRSLPNGLPKAVASSSSTRWIRSHLEHIGLGGAFGGHIYSGREHVERGKPAPDLYLHAANALGVAIEWTAIIEDSRVGVTGALASGATVIGLAAGSHCLDGHGDMLRNLGVEHIATSFDQVAHLLGLDQASR
jgi:HAD superfamily hydrolase (TIGR01509 family)